MPVGGDLEPTELCTWGRTLRLKWHQMRRRRADPPFSRRNLLDGLAAGASLEVDLRPLACGRFVCLHDPLLESETTGEGPVAAMDADRVAQLRMREGGEPPLLLEELVDIVSAAPQAAAALVQLDLQKGVEIGAAARASFAAALDGKAHRFLLGGYDFEAISRLGGEVPGLAFGYDPSDVALNEGADVLRLVRDRAPDADTIYLHRLLVRASRKRGDDLVARLAERGHRVDCWTLDHGTEGAAADLAAAVATGCHQITTNTPLAWVAAGL